MKFNASLYELSVMKKIAERMVAMHREITGGDGLMVHEVIMDLDAVHSNHVQLNLHELLHAAPSDFAHDVAGIRHHLDRKTGRLTGCFMPRYAMKSADLGDTRPR